MHSYVNWQLTIFLTSSYAWCDFIIGATQEVGRIITYCELFLCLVDGAAAPDPSSKFIFDNAGEIQCMQFLLFSDRSVTELFLLSK